MKIRKRSTPVVIDLVNCEQTPRPKAFRTPSVVDLTNSEPDVIVLDTPQTRSRKRKLTETLSRSSSVSESEVVVLSSSFGLKKKIKTLFTPPMRPRPGVVVAPIKPTLSIGGVTPPASSRPGTISSKKKRKSVKKNQRKSVKNKKRNSVKKKQSLTLSNKKVAAKNKRKLADISNLASYQSKRSSIGSPAPLSKAASDYYARVTKAILNENINNPVKNTEQKKKYANKCEKITRTVKNGVTTSSFKPAITKRVEMPVSNSRIPLPPHQTLPKRSVNQRLFHRFSPNPHLSPRTRLNRAQARTVVQNRFNNNSNFCGTSAYRQRQNLATRLQQQNFNNVHNPNPINLEEEGFRPIIIDGCNVAFGHGRGKFSPKGLQICVDFFNKRGMDRVKVFLPQSNQALIPQNIVEDLQGKCEVVFTPTLEVNGVVKKCYDDRFIVQYANEVGGIIVSTDQYRDLLKEKPAWKHVIETRLLMFSWVDDLIMFPQDPLGKHGPTLQEFLKF